MVVSAEGHLGRIEEVLRIDTSLRYGLGLHLCANHVKMAHDYILLVIATSSLDEPVRDVLNLAFLNPRNKEPLLATELFNAHAFDIDGHVGQVLKVSDLTNLGELVTSLLLNEY